MTRTGTTDHASRWRALLRIERDLAAVRIGMAALAGPFLAAAIASDATSLRVIAALTLGLTALVSIAVRMVIDDTTDPTVLRRLAVLTMAMDGASLLAVSATPVAPGTFHASSFVLLGLPIIGALKFNRVGGTVGGLLVVGATAVTYLRAEGQAFDASTYAAIAAVGGLAVSLGLFLGRLSAAAQDREDRLAAEADALSVALDDARARARDAAIAASVVNAGLRELSDGGISQMIKEVAAQLDDTTVVLALLEADGCARIVGSSDDAPGSPAMIPDPGGPMERILGGGPSEYVTADELADLTIDRPGVEHLVLAPVHGRAGLLGLLAVLGGPGSKLVPEDAPRFQAIADQIGLVTEAVNAFRREADLAERHRELDRMRRDFVAITGHELRTPLTAIRGNAKLLTTRADRLTDDQRTDLLQAIERQSDRLLGLVDDLQVATKLEAGQMQVRRQRVDLATSMTEVRESLPAIPFATAGSDGLAVLGDPDRLHQIIVNLVRNAAEHGAPPIDVTWRLDEARSLVRIHVNDRGPGVPRERRDQIFERFVTGRRATSHHRGSGLGLAICRDLAAMMDGTLTLLDTPRATTFELALHWADRANHPTPGPPDEAPAGTSASHRVDLRDAPVA